MAANTLSPFNPPWFWRGAHLQSVLGSLPLRRWWVRRRAATVCRLAHQTLIDCGDGVRLQGLHSRQPSRSAGAVPLAVLLHGWEGSAESGHVLSLAATLFEAGFDVLRLNLRDHGHTEHLNRELFHSCRLPELMGALRAIAAREPQVPLYLAGFSLGGNFWLRAAADPGLPRQVRAVAAVSPVLDPAVTLAALERGAPLYRRHFVRRWSRSLRAKQRAWPQWHDFSALVRLADLRAMTAELVLRCTDFPHIDAYLAGYAVTGERLRSLAVPAHVLLAEDDPLIPHQDLERLAASPLLDVQRTRYGGHCGFFERLAGSSFADRWVRAQLCAARLPGAHVPTARAQNAVSSAGASGS